MSILSEQDYLAYANTMRPDLSESELREMADCTLAQMAEMSTRVKTDDPVQRSHAMATVLHRLSCGPNGCGIQ